MNYSTVEAATNGAIASIASAIKPSQKNIDSLSSLLEQLTQELRALPEKRVAAPYGDFIGQLDSSGPEELPLFRADKQYPFVINAPTEVRRLEDCSSFDFFVSCSAFSDVVRLQLQMPCSVFRPQDYQNFRYWDKFICILAYTKAHLELVASISHQLHWTIGTDWSTQAPVLIGSIFSLMSSSLEIRICVALPEMKNEIKRLRPNKSAIKASSSESTPFYNAATMSVIRGAAITDSVIHNAKSVKNFGAALRVIKLWAHNKFAVSALKTCLTPWHLTILLSNFCATRDIVIQNASVLQILILFFTSMEHSSSLQIWDPDYSFHNWLWDCCGCLGELQALSHHALLLLQSAREDRIHQFLSTRKLLQQDCDLVLISDPLPVEMTPDGCLRLRDAAQAIRGLIEAALKDRVAFLLERFVQDDKAARLLVGMKLDSADLKLVEHIWIGPDVEDQSSAGAFQRIWGSKAEERQLSDGRTVMALVWQPPSQSSQSTLNEVIGPDRDAVPAPITQALRYLCMKDASVKRLKMRVESWWRLCDDVINDPQERQVDRSIMEFRSTISMLDGVATALRDVQLVSSAARHTNIPFCKRCRFMWSNQGALTTDFDPHEAGCQLLECVLEVDSSSRWPRDKEILRSIKLGILLQIQRSLADNHSIRSSISPDGFLDVFFNSYIAFRVRLLSNLEYNLNLLWFVNTRLPIPDTKNIDHSIIELARAIYWRPAHHTMIESACKRFTSLGGAIRLVRRWVGAQWITDQDLVEFWELLLLHVYESSLDCSLSRIESPNCGFWSLMAFMAQRPLGRQPIFVGPIDCKASMIKAWENSHKLQNRRCMWLATSIDPYCLFVRLPTSGEYKRLVCFARAVVGLSPALSLRNMAREIFSLNLNQFSCLILTEPPRQLLKSKNGSKAEPKNLPPRDRVSSLLKSEPGKHIYPQTGLLLHDAFQMAFEQLESEFAGGCLFSRNSWHFPYAMMIGVNFVKSPAADFKDKIRQILGDFVSQIVFRDEDPGVWRRAKEQISLF
eukprot:Gregarina_sp_Poly_1__3558@NODE_203_length_11516_cov_57_501703_g181_i0_p1_GENE_NODE_203_length_11516_cov_57_501703_g181_i0NODE_203_length_11516_cov_57_501703_g181_i0_p1_ORF_typecomplete_len1017_score120_80Nrap_D4/PF17405_2/7_9e21Nrap/PF03813_14/3_4e13Nrap_D5/PF17406_2/5_2e03Nrap_D5/PF17406_2/1_4e11Nrap_D3/PF17404_2/1_3e10PAP_central/PF04928_17/8_7e07DUF4486/PF14858_6/0_23Nrap_D2/PF17403_2/1_8Nrap_D2/PF17403_2/1_1e03_NODE_203_length_11516_cov_57_501703_g181_i017394789